MKDVLTYIALAIFGLLLFSEKKEQNIPAEAQAVFSSTNEAACPNCWTFCKPDCEEDCGCMPKAAVKPEDQQARTEIIQEAAATIIDIVNEPEQHDAVKTVSTVVATRERKAATVSRGSNCANGSCQVSSSRSSDSGWYLGKNMGRRRR